jgi:hypothetical protein
MADETTEGDEIVVTALKENSAITSDGAGGGGDGGFDGWGWGCLFSTSYDGGGTFNFGIAGTLIYCQPPEAPPPQTDNTTSDFDALKTLDDMGSVFVTIAPLAGGGNMATVFNQNDGNNYVFGFDGDGNAILRGLYPAPLDQQHFLPATDPLPGGNEVWA